MKITACFFSSDEREPARVHAENENKIECFPSCMTTIEMQSCYCYYN